MKFFDLSGVWKANADRLGEFEVSLPGTLDTNGIGFPDTAGKQWHPDVEIGNAEELIGESAILTRLTRKHTYEGSVFYTKKIVLGELNGKRLFLEAERSRELSLQINGKDVPAYTPGTLSTPYVYEVTDFVRVGENIITLCCDNLYTNFPRDAIIGSSAVTDETQTNWNGVLGYIRLRYENGEFISSVRTYPHGDMVDVYVELDCGDVDGDIIDKKIVHKTMSIENVEKWDEYNGVLCELEINEPGFETIKTRVGKRDFGVKNGKLALNGRVIFLRCETNCCVFPKTGYMPMGIEEWKEILMTYKSYGVNCVRFHSHCPPGAAFSAADELGMLLYPELSHWDVRRAFEDEKSWNYFQLELRQILLNYANHPSFVMFALGNELNGCGVLGYKRMQLLVQTAKQIDPTRLYAIGSNNFIGKFGPDSESDFYSSFYFYETHLRGTSAQMVGYINEQYPSSKTNFDEELKLVRREFDKPVFGFEVGQYEILPDFDEWNDHEGVTVPNNYWHIRERVEELGFMPDWKKRVEATGELSLIGYREEIEVTLRTENFSGISLLGLQDFTGQGTALVGMLNAHLEAKPYKFAEPERFRRFFNDVVPLVILDKYTYTSNEKLSALIKVANYGRENLNVPCVVRLTSGGEVVKEIVLPQKVCLCGGLNEVGVVEFILEELIAPQRLDITVEIGEAINSYPIWVYPDIGLVVPDTVMLTQDTAEAITALAGGKTVFLTPEATEVNFPNSIKTYFTTDFWSVGTFPKQSGFMGCLVDPRHRVFEGFPTEFHSNWQWWAMCQGRAMILPREVSPLVTALDCYARMRHMGMLLEFNVGAGKLVVSSMGLMERMEYPEVRAFTQSIVNYMDSEGFRPKQDISVDVLNGLVR